MQSTGEAALGVLKMYAKAICSGLTQGSVLAGKPEHDSLGRTRHAFPEVLGICELLAADVVFSSPGAFAEVQL